VPLAALALAAGCATAQDDPPRRPPGGVTDASAASGGAGSAGDGGEAGGAGTGSSGAAAATGGAAGASGNGGEAPDGAAGSGGSDAGAGGSVAGAGGSGTVDAGLEAGADAADGGGERLLLLARSATSVLMATRAAGAWSSSTAAVALGATPGIVATPEGALAAAPQAGTQALLFTSFDAGSGSWSGWSASGGDLAIGTPALARATGTVLVYLGTDYRLWFRTHAPGSGWAATSKVEHGGVQSFGPSAPTAAAQAADVVIAQEGDDHDLHDQRWSGGAWQAGQAHALAIPIATGTSPALVATPAGNLIAAWVEAGSLAIRLSELGGSGWSVPETVPAATSTDPPALLALAGGRLLVAWRGSADQRIWIQERTAEGWGAASAPAGAAVSPAPPSLARGLDGHDAELAIATGGAVMIASLDGSGWSTPAPVAAAGWSAVTAAAWPP
jgi:hypothetical protein